MGNKKVTGKQFHLIEVRTEHIDLLMSDKIIAVQAWDVTGDGALSQFLYLNEKEARQLVRDLTNYLLEYKKLHAQRGRTN